MNKEPFVVLMAEDDEHDIVAVRRAWQKQQIANPLHIVNNGEECLDYLYRRGKFSEPGAAPRPGILLLDIKMPKMDGLAVLEQIRRSDEFHRLPVIMLTTSKDDEDRLKSYNLRANAYIIKPIGFGNFSMALKTINLFWELVELPEDFYGNA
jgi:CheY-like chemotaxis protein